MSEKRRDKKNRILRNGESQRADGRYAYVYVDGNGKQKFLYSWKLESTDKLPQGKRDCVALREKIKALKKDLENGIASNGGIQVYQRKRIFGHSQVVYYLRKSGDTAYYSLGRVKPRTGNAFRERICCYVADDAALCARIRNSDTWRDKTVLMLRDYHIGNQP